MGVKFRRSPITKTKDKIEIEYNTNLNANVEKALKKELTFKPKRHTFIALILRKNGSALICYVPIRSKSFSVENNTYFNVKSGSYIIPRKAILTVYLEGCVMPIEHRYIVYTKHNVLLVDNMGCPVKEINENVSKDDIMTLPKNNQGQFLKTKDGYIIKKVLDRIKGLEFDSVIANAIYNSGLIEKVSRAGTVNKIMFWIFILLIINIVVSIGAIIGTQL